MLRHELARTFRISPWTRLRRPGRRRPPGNAGQIRHRDLARAIRRLPERFTDRLPDDTLHRLSIAASGGQWEQTIDELICALRVHDQPVTAEERDQLLAVLKALSLPTGPLHKLAVRR